MNPNGRDLSIDYIQAAPKVYQKEKGQHRHPVSEFHQD